MTRQLPSVDSESAGRRLPGRQLASVFAFLLIPGYVLAATDVEQLRSKLNESRLRYDLPAAESVRDQARVWNQQQPNADSSRFLGNALLLVAELLRIQFEEEKEAHKPERREIGRDIDAAAQEGLRALEAVPADSEIWRTRADLIGTMIRSDFQAQKFRKKLDDAIAQALALDPKNARAYVSQSKTYLFAPEHHGKDLPKGIEVLDKALALDPKLEPALLLRAYAYDQLGQRDLAVTDWKAALLGNPSCKPAKEKIDPHSGNSLIVSVPSDTH